MSDETVLYLVRAAVERQQGLIYGRLHDGLGGHCAIGSLWSMLPQVAIRSALVDEVAAVNDSVPPERSPLERWLKVRSWLRWKLRVLATRKPVPT